MEAHDPQEELERVKAWWKAYGGAIIAGVVIGVILLAAVNYWRGYRAEQAAAASQLFEQVVRGAEQKNAEQARQATDKLMQDYAGTPYAGKAALYLAKLDYAAGDVAAARKHLQWAVENAKEAPVKHVARLRLARILLAAKETGEAERLLATKETDGFESEYEDVRGDLFVVLGKPDDARRAYQAARQALPPGSPYARVLDMKLDDLGPEKQG